MRYERDPPSVLECETPRSSELRGSQARQHNPQTRSGISLSVTGSLREAWRPLRSKKHLQSLGTSPCSILATINNQKQRHQPLNVYQPLFWEGAVILRLPFPEIGKLIGHQCLWIALKRYRIYFSWSFKSVAICIMKNIIL